MRKIFKSLAFVAAAAAMLVSCNKEMIESTPSDDSMVEITLTTDEILTKTELDTDGKTPLWSKGDKIGVCTEVLSSNFSFDNNGTAASATTTFSGSVPADAQTLFAYSPFTSNGRFSDGLVKMDIPNVQFPTSTTFDPAADILCAESLASSTTFDGATLRFQRISGLLKVVLSDVDNKLASEKLVSLKVSTNDKNILLTGRSKMDLVNRTLSKPYYNASQIAEANYAEADRFAINGQNPVYLGVIPQDLPANTVVTIEGETENFLFKKVKTLNEIFHIYAGKFSILNVGLVAADIIVPPAGLSLPFEDNMLWAKTSGSSIKLDESPLASDGKTPLYAKFTNVYYDNQGMKVGKSDGKPGLTTSPLNLSKLYTVVVNAKFYGSDNTKLQLLVDGNEKSAQTAQLTTGMKQYVFDCPAAKRSSDLTLSTVKGGTRMYLDGFYVYEGHGSIIILPEKNFTLKGFAHNTSVNYSLIHAQSGVSVSAIASESWIKNIVADSQTGICSFDVEDNKTGTVRKGTITLNYAGANPAIINIEQEIMNTAPVVEMDVFSELVYDMDQNISYKAEKGGASTAPAINGDQIRIYQNGGLFTVSAKNGKKITEIILGSDMKTTVVYSIDGGADTANQAIAKGGKLTLSNLNATTVKFTCTGTNSKSRLYVNYLKVSYK